MAIEETKQVIDLFFGDYFENVEEGLHTTLFHPFRAVCLARALTGISVRELVGWLSLSRSYIVSLENYSRSLTPDTQTAFLQLVKNLNDNPFLDEKMMLFREVLFRFGLMEPERISFLFDYFRFFEQFFYEPRLVLPLKVLLFECLAATLKTTSAVIYHDIYELFNPDMGRAYHFVEPLIILWSSGFFGWPYFKVPRVILTTGSEFSLLSGFLLGVISASELVEFYQNKLKGFSKYPSKVLFDRVSLKEGIVKPLGVMALAAFLFTEISVKLTTEAIFFPPATKTPVDIEVDFFDGGRYSEIGPLHYFFSDYILGIPPERLCKRVEDVLSGPSKYLLQRLNTHKGQG
ncbi:hypothetical protein EDD75_2200 [Thermodesulfitimonas autotrophica]|uniref:Uncharacterized protein n=1 Tax=Thermodesulfitimonas autotrophica TaxID=1894989 RepID=A0A3N5ABX2_9THEO|nr:hypothetical protein [Thermodesulfitimonas autotrophica]RPF43079.1 hypothetical protein EDD75_2200 [Thermodesulfitimonas autotrophica]